MGQAAGGRDDKGQARHHLQGEESGLKSVGLVPGGLVLPV